MPDTRPLVTFDCFDTVITRAVGSPDAIGYVTGLRLHRQGLVPHRPEVLAAARSEAERLAWDRSGDDYTIEDVAEQQAGLLGLPPGAARTLLEAELETEVELSRAVPGMHERVQAARDSGARVGFLSDTPLPHSFIEGLLRRHDLMHDGDLLWVSNELRAGKRRATAYSEVVRRLGSAPSSWTHYGDDELADVRNARWVGVQPVHLTAATLNRYEHELERYRTASGGLASVLAGASRRTRVELAHTRPDVPAALVGVTAGVAGPLLTGFLLWCFQQAQLAGVRRLYFVSRDGEVLLEMAQHLVKGLDLDLDLRYLYGSRKAWLLTGDPSTFRDSLVAVAGREDVVTVRTTLEWFELTPEQVGPALLRQGFGPQEWERRLSAEELERVADVVPDPDVWPLLLEVAARSTEASRSYLDSVGMLDGEPFALVEMVGRATTGRFLSRLLQQLGATPPTQEYYFGLGPEVAQPKDRELLAYMFDDWRGTGVAKRELDLWVPLEAFTQARHGHVLGYRVTAGTPEPVLERPVNEALVGWGLDGYRAALDVFSSEVARGLRWVDPWGDVRRPGWEALRSFWLTPTESEVAVWGDFPLDYDGRILPMGRGYTGAEFLASVRELRPRFRARGTWPAAVRQTSARPVRAVNKAAVLARTVAAKARRARQLVQDRRTVRAGA